MAKEDDSRRQRITIQAVNPIGYEDRFKKRLL